VSRPWLEPRRGASPAHDAGAGVRRLGIVATVLLLVQLAIASVMRHSFAGLAIPTFPLSPNGGLVPSHWDFGIAINFAHRAMAAVLAVILVWFAVAVWRDRAAGAGLKRLAAAMVALLCVQIGLGASIIWTARNPYVTTAHVLVGALTLAATFLLAWALHRDRLEAADAVRIRDGRAQPAGAAAAPDPRRKPVGATVRA
jgi:heme a synthase